MFLIILSTLLREKYKISTNYGKNHFLRLWFYEHKRKNWLFSGSPKGAVVSAAIYSLIETCKANKINEYKYLKYLFETLPNIPFLREPQLLEEHLPWSEKIQQICK
jgi:hypothetical protein